MADIVGRSWRFSLLVSCITGRFAVEWIDQGRSVVKKGVEVSSKGRDVERGSREGREVEYSTYRVDQTGKL